MGTAASAAPGWTVVPTVDPSASTNVLNGVAVRGPADAWPVGFTDVFAHTLALRETG